MDQEVDRHSTPRKPVLHGAAGMEQDPIPHVCFLLSDSSTAGQKAVLRTLLLLHTKVHPLFTWSFEVVRPRNKPILKSKNAKLLLGLDATSLAFFVEEIRKISHSEIDKILAKDSNHNHIKDLKSVPLKDQYEKQKCNDQAAESKECNILDIMASIASLVSQVTWNSAPAVQHQSPLKIPDSKWKTWTGSAKLRNYLILIAPTPSNSAGLSSLCQFTGLDNSASLQFCLDVVAQEFFRPDIWKSLVMNRTALYWLQTAPPENNTTNSEYSPIIHSWISGIMAQFGGSFISSSLFFSKDFSQTFLKMLKPMPIDLAASKPIMGQTDTSKRKESFLASLEKFNLYKPSKAWSGSLELSQPTTVWPEGLASLFNVSLFSHHTIQNLSPIFELQLSNYSSISILGVLPITNELCATTQTTVYCTGSTTCNVHDFQKFSDMLYYIESTSTCILLQIGEDQLAILTPFLQGICKIQFFQIKESINHALSLTKQYLKSFESTLQTTECPSTLHDYNLWITNPWPIGLQEFIKSGIILPNHSKFIEKMCMGIWTISSAKLIPTPKKRVVGKKKDAKDGPPEIKPENMYLSNDIVVGPFSNVKEALQGLSDIYTSILFEKYPLDCLIEQVFPSFYEQLMALSEKENGNAIETLVDYYTGHLIQSIENIEKKYMKRFQELLFLIDGSEPPADSIEPIQKLLMENWLLKKKQKKATKGDDLDMKKLLKEGVKDLKIRESQLQIILWLECLRVYQDTGIPLPNVDLFKRKKKDLTDTPTHIEKAIYALMDKLLIWTVCFNGSTEDTNLWREFVNPLLVCFYHESLPTIIQQLANKTGGIIGEEQASAVRSPAFKPGPVKRKKPKVNPGLVNKAPSIKDNMSKRLSDRNIMKKKRKTSKDDNAPRPSNDENQEKTQVTLEDFFAAPPLLSSRKQRSEKTKNESVFVPETPTSKSASKLLLVGSPSQLGKSPITKGGNSSLYPHTPLKQTKRSMANELLSPIWQ